MERLVCCCRADWGRHEGVSSKDRRRNGAKAGARSVDLCDAALFGGITSEVATLSHRAGVRDKVGDNTWEMETLARGTRGDWLERGRSSSRGGYLLDRIVAEVADDAKMPFLLRGNHGGRGWAEARVSEDGVDTVFKDAASTLSPTRK